MDYDNFIQSLKDARTHAQAQGRPLSAQEAQAVTGPLFHQEGVQQLQSQALNTDYDRLAQERWKTMAMMNAADQSNRNMLWQNLIKGGGSLAMMSYFNPQNNGG